MERFPSWFILLLMAVLGMLAGGALYLLTAWLAYVFG
jgi:ABC-type uncharacterized transport system permease subunit